MQTTTHQPPMALCSVIDRGVFIEATATNLSPEHSITAALHACLAAETLLPYLVIDPADRVPQGMGADLVGDALHRYGLRQYRPNGNRSLADRAWALRDALTHGAIRLISIHPETEPNQ
jgi:hypothetical protein